MQYCNMPLQPNRHSLKLKNPPRACLHWLRRLPSRLDQTSKPDGAYCSVSSWKLKSGFDEFPLRAVELNLLLSLICRLVSVKETRTTAVLSAIFTRVIRIWYTCHWATTRERKNTIHGLELDPNACFKRSSAKLLFLYSGARTAD